MKLLTSIFLALISLIAVPAYTQVRITALYKSAADLTQNINTFSQDNPALKRSTIFRNKKFIIKYRDTNYVFLKKDLYGYRDIEENNFRFFENKDYLILNPGDEILLYSLTSGTGLKNSPKITMYYFSKNAGSDLLVLSIYNVQQVFSSNIPFRLLIGLHCTTDKDLILYYPDLNCYKINFLFELSKK